MARLEVVDVNRFWMLSRVKRPPISAKVLRDSDDAGSGALGAA
uniref:Uncharacterized protein n=1 Tax=Arundo donax TaxID=35708 RepID=A0A0A9GRR9_ARUDO